MKRATIALAALVAVAVTATLTGCASHEVRASSIASALRGLPGVTYVSSNGYDGSLLSPSSGMTVSVEVEPTISVSDANKIVETWIDVSESSDSSSELSVSADSMLAPDVPLGGHALYFNRLDIDEEQALAATTLWATLLPTMDEVVIGIDPDSHFINVTSSKAVDATSLVDLVADVARVASPELDSFIWSIGSHDDAFDDVSGIAVSANSGLPDAELLALVTRLDSALSTASLSGGYQVYVNDNANSEFLEAAAYTVNVTLDPDDLSTVPGLEVEGRIPTSSAWTSAQAFADALREDDDVELLLAVFHDDTFAGMLTASCERLAGPYGAELRQYWSGSPCE